MQFGLSDNMLNSLTTLLLTRGLSMVFGRCSFVRSGSLLACGLAFSAAVAAQTQQQPASPPAEATVPALPAALPVSQAAAGGTPNNSDYAKPAENGSINSSTSGNSGTPGRESSSLRLGPGDLIEVGVYNVPELSTK